jgi:pyruvate-ferredoxin/flavodoxin oxidoreductase
MTDRRSANCPKSGSSAATARWATSGFQNLSKVILQNRPNVKGIMLDTQVYSNTGGQNSDSSNMLGGYDMNQFGKAASRAS